MERSGFQARPGSPATPLGRPARVVAAVRAILRPRVGALSWAGSRLLAGAILAAGLLAQALFGWRWWLVVIVLTVAGEAILVCSTLARTPEREELVDELLAALAPGRRERRLARLEADRFRAAPFALYGLPPSWRGQRFLGRWSSTRPRHGPELTTSLELGHGDPGASAGPLLRVEVAPWTSSARPGPSRRPEASRRVEITVDGVPVGFEVGFEGGFEGAFEVAPEAGFEVAGTGRRWTARGEHGALVLRLEGRDLDPARVSLVRVADLGPYLAGPATRQLAPGA